MPGEEPVEAEGERALAVDNIFVFIVVFATPRVRPVHRHRILFWGIVGALVMRAAFVLAARRCSSASTGSCTCSVRFSSRRA